MPRTLLSCPICEIANSVRAKRQRRKEARPGELLDAALDLFVEKGFAATRVEEVAQRAGVSKGTLFLYFSSKEELFKAVVRENISGRFSEWNNVLETFQGSTADLLRYSMLTWWKRIGSTKASGISKLMMSEAGNFPELAAFYQQEVIRPAQELIRRILQRGIDRGEFAVHDLDSAVYTVVAPMLLLAISLRNGGVCLSSALINPQKYLETQAETILHGLVRRTIPSPPPLEHPTA